MVISKQFQNNVQKINVERKTKWVYLPRSIKAERSRSFDGNENYNKQWNNRNENYNQQWNKLNIRSLFTQHVHDMDWKWIIQNNIGFNNLHVSCFRVLRSIQKLQDSWSTCSFLDWGIVLHFKDMGEPERTYVKDVTSKNM